MENEKLKRMIESGYKFSCSLLKYALTLALVGLMAIMYYQAGRAEMFNYPANADEFCEQHEKDLKATNEHLIELRNTNKGEVYGEE